MRLAALAIAALLLGARIAAAAITVVQTASCALPNLSTPSASCNAAFSASVTKGNNVIVGVIIRDATGGPYTGYTLSITDTLATGYSSLTNAAGQAPMPWIFYATLSSRNRVQYNFLGTPVASGSDTIACQVTSGVSIKGGACFAFELAGLPNTILSTADSYNTINQTVCVAGDLSLNPLSGATGFANPGVISWTGNPFIMGMADDANGQAGSFAAQHAMFYSTITQNGSNIAFGAIYGVANAMLTSPDLVGWRYSGGLGCGDVTYGAIAIGQTGALHPFVWINE